MFIDYLLCCEDVFLTDGILFIYFCFCWLCCWCHSHKIVVKTNVINLSPIFSSRSFTVSDLTFRSNLFWIEFVYSARDKKIISHNSAPGYLDLPTPFIEKTTAFPLVILCIFVKEKWVVEMWIYFQDFLLCFISLYLFYFIFIFYFILFYFYL